MAKTLTVYLAADLNKFNRGMNDAERQAQGFGGTLNSMLGPALIAGAAAAGAFAVKLGVDGVQAAIADEAAAAKLATTLGNLGLAHEAAGVEDYIDQMQRATGIADDDLRPSYDRLIRSVKDTAKANELLALSTDIAAGTGKSLDAVVQALGRAYDGNTAGLSRLGAGLDSAILKSGNMDLITEKLSQTFAGQAATASQTYEGQLNRLNIAADELKESFGYGLLTALGDTESGTQDLTGAMQDAEPVIRRVGESIGTFASDIVYLTGKLGQATGKLEEFKNDLGPIGTVMSWITTSPLSMLTGGLKQLDKVAGQGGKQFEYLQYAAYDAAGGLIASANAADETAIELEDVAKKAFLAAGSFAALATAQAEAERKERDWAGTSGTVQAALLDLARKGRDVANVTTNWTDEWNRLNSAIGGGGGGGGGGAVDSIKDATSEIDTLADAIREVDDALLASAEEGLQTWQTALDAAMGDLDAKQAEIRDFANGIRDDLLDAFDIGKAFESALQKDGAVSAEKWIQGVDEQIAQIEWFGNVLQAIKSSGGSQDLIDYLAEQGAETGGQMGQALIDQGLVSTMSAKLTTVTDAAGKIGEALVPEFMYAGVASAAAMVDSIAAEVLASEDHLKKIGKAIGRPIGNNLEAEIAASVAAALTAAESAKTAAEARRVNQQAQAAAAGSITDQQLGQALQRVISNSNARTGYQFTPGQTLVFG